MVHESGHIKIRMENTYIVDKVRGLVWVLLISGCRNEDRLTWVFHQLLEFGPLHIVDRANAFNALLLLHLVFDWGTAHDRVYLVSGSESGIRDNSGSGSFDTCR